MTRWFPAIALIAVSCGLGALFGAAAQAQTPQSVQTNVAFVEAGPGAVGETIELSARVMTLNGAPVDGAVEFFIDGIRFRRVRTDAASGIATVDVREGLAVGNHTVTAVFVGARDRGLEESTTSTTVTIAPLALAVETVPLLAGVSFELRPENVVGAPAGFAGYTFQSNGNGIARVAVDYPGTYQLIAEDKTGDATDVDSNAAVRATFDRWDTVRQPMQTLDVGLTTRVQAGYRVDYLVSQTFLDESGRPIPEERIEEINLLASNGDKKRFDQDDPLCANPTDREIGCARWFLGTRVKRLRNGLELANVKYSVESLFVDGANVVNQAQQQFHPALPEDHQWEIKLQLHSARFTSRDAIFRFPVGSGITLLYPDGQMESHAFDSDGELTLEGLARGQYEVTVDARGMSFKRPVVLSRDQEVDLLVITYLDMAVVAFIGVSILVGLTLLGRPRLRRQLFYRLGRVSVPAYASLRRSAETSPRGDKTAPPRSITAPRRFFLSLGVMAALVLAGTVLACSLTVEAQQDPNQGESETPTFAYYYIWFDRGSWDRAKTDYPLLGRYSSDDTEIMRTHIEWAKEAGIDGFIVSWKHTDQLTRRLEKLIEVAEAEDFDLAIIYQGLDFYRLPLPVSRIQSDLDFFVRRFSQRPPFQGFGEPVVILSGSWMFSSNEIATLSAGLRDDLQFLAAERSPEGYQRVAGLVDGTAYYWSSVEPDTFEGYEEKLNSMSDAVHARGGLWIAPAAPGFDARLIGGTRLVEREDGDTLRQQLEAATGSSPDVVGLISWNEFSENSHIEPSENYDTQSLDVIAEVLGNDAPAITDIDSSSGGGPSADFNYSLPLVGGAVALFIGGTGVLVFRRSRQSRSPQAGKESLADGKPQPGG